MNIIEQLDNFSIAELEKLFQELFGKAPTSNNCLYLSRNIAYKSQENEAGGFPKPLAEKKTADALANFIFFNYLQIKCGYESYPYGGAQNDPLLSLIYQETSDTLQALLIDQKELIAMNVEKNEKGQIRCPSCLEKINKKAKICKICGEFINRWDRVTNKNFIPIIIGVCIGLISGIVTFHYASDIEERQQKEIRLAQEKRQNETTKLLLKEEFTHNYVNLQHLDEWLKKNRGYMEREVRIKGSLEQAGVVIIDLFNLNFKAWEAAKLNNPKFLIKLSKEDFQILQDYYFNLDRLQTMISHREAFRIANYGGAWYAQHIKTRDDNIMVKVKEMSNIIGRAGNYLFEEDWEARLGKLLW